MADENEKKDRKAEETFMVPRRWDQLELSEKAEIERRRDGFVGTAADRAYIEKIESLSKKHFGVE